MMTDLGSAGAITLMVILFMIWISNESGDKYTAGYLKRDLFFLTLLFVSVGYVYPAVCWLTK
jgi:hypothetical protein